MEVFKLIGNLIVNGADQAKKDIEDTGKTAEKATGVFEQVGTAIKKSFTGEKVEALGASLEKLTGSISEQQKKLELLKKKYMDLYIEQGETADETKDVAAEIEKLSDELTRNEKALDNAKKSADSFDRSLEDVGQEGKEAGDDIQGSWQGVISKFQATHPVLATVATKIAAVGAAVVAVGKAMVTVANNTREYRLEIGKLETAFTSAGHSTQEATATYQELYSVLGETDRAVEASQHIAKLCANEEEMKAMTEALIGVFAEFDDSLPLEGLAEAANETAKTGQVTGVLADAVNWAGASEAEFQEKLNACNSERERAALIIGELSSLYRDAATAYKKNNAEVIAATSAQEKLNAATARWGELVEPAVTLFTEGLAAAISAAADAFEFLIDPTGAAGAALAGTSETAAEAQAKIEDFQGQLAALAEIPPILWTDEHTQQQAALSRALAIAQSDYENLTAAEQNAAEAAEASSASTADAAAEFSEVTAQYVADASALFEKFAATYEGIFNKVSGWFEPFGKATVTVTTSISDMMSAMQSQIDFNTNYSANLQKLSDYGLGSLSEAFQSYGAEGAAYAETIVKAVEQAGGATTAEGQEIIKSFNELNGKVAESQGELTQTMATMSGEFEEELQKVVASYDAAIEGLDKSAEAQGAATSTFDAFLSGMNSKIPGILETMTSFGQQITSSLQSGIDDIHIPFQFVLPGSGSAYNNAPGSGGVIGSNNGNEGNTGSNNGNGLLDGSHASGLDYVPFDGYIAELHRGEMVVPADEARGLRNGASGAVANADVANILLMILEAVQEGNDRDYVFRMNNREFGRAVRGVVNA